MICEAVRYENAFYKIGLLHRRRMISDLLRDGVNDNSGVEFR